jgi:hypothetical protein
MSHSHKLSRAKHQQKNKLCLLWLLLASGTLALSKPNKKSRAKFWKKWIPTSYMWMYMYFPVSLRPTLSLNLMVNQSGVWIFVQVFVRLCSIFLGLTENLILFNIVYSLLFSNSHINHAPLSTFYYHGYCCLSLDFLQILCCMFWREIHA